MCEDGTFKGIMSCKQTDSTFTLDNDTSYGISDPQKKYKQLARTPVISPEGYVGGGCTAHATPAAYLDNFGHWIISPLWYTRADGALQGQKQTPSVSPILILNQLECAFLGS